MKRLGIVCVLAFSAFGWQQLPPDKIPPPGSTEDVKLPNGKSQKDEIIKADYKKNLEDSAKLLKIAEDLRSDLENGDRNVVSVKIIKETEDIDHLAKAIHGRLTRN